MEKDKMVKTAKALNTVFLALQRIFLICAIVCAVLLCLFTVVYFRYPDSVVGSGIDQIDIGPLTFALTRKIGLNREGLLLYVWIMVAAAVALIATAYYALRIIRNILAPMTQGDPFHPTVGKEIRKLAFASLAIGILQNVIGAAEVCSVLHIFDLNVLLQSSQIQSVTANFRYDLSFIVIFFVLLLMSHIFRYGEELQKLSDETL